MVDEVLNGTLLDVLRLGGVDLVGMDTGNLLADIAGVKVRIDAKLADEPNEWEATNLATAQEFLANYKPAG